MPDHRLSIEITQEQSVKMQKLFPHGTKKLVFNLIINDLIRLLEKHGSGKILSSFIDRQIKLEELIKIKGISNGYDF